MEVFNAAKEIAEVEKKNRQISETEKAVDTKADTVGKNQVNLENSNIEVNSNRIN